eukprot:m.9104 g.9104  ORF g.9104 m.9104 type:complete len:59 (-) comp9360_c0_seq1:330-506(-)
MVSNSLKSEFDCFHLAACLLLTRTVYYKASSLRSPWLQSTPGGQAFSKTCCAISAGLR